MRKGSEFFEDITHFDDPLLCDRCYKEIGFVYEVDLNGSYFICVACHKELSNKCK